MINLGALANRLCISIDLQHSRQIPRVSTNYARDLHGGIETALRPVLLPLMSYSPVPPDRFSGLVVA